MKASANRVIGAEMQSLRNCPSGELLILSSRETQVFPRAVLPY